MKSQHKSIIRRAATLTAGVVVGLSFFTGSAFASTNAGQGNQGQTSATKDCDGTHHSNTGNGANTSGPYDNTCVPAPSGNGKGGGNATGKPCAGCVGNADDKNPPGQLPGPQDHNNGYECDGNQGIAKTNPAHTGCRDTTADNGGDTPGDTGGGDDSTPPPSTPGCPAGDAAMTAHHYLLNDTTVVGDLTGWVHPGDNVEAIFTIAPGCPDRVLSLASYSGAGAFADSDTGTFGPGEHSLEVQVPSCDFQVDFVRGAVLPHLGPAAGNNPYGTRLIDADNGGSSACAAPQAAVPPAVNAANDASAGTPVEAAPAPAPAAVEAVSVLAEAPAAAVAPVDEVLPAAPSSPASPAAQVLGVQYERAASPLAFTGAGRGLALLTVTGLLLCLAGAAAVATARKQA